MEKAAAEESELISQNEGICDETASDQGDDVGDALGGMKSPGFYKRLDKCLDGVLESSVLIKQVFKKLSRVINATISTSPLERNSYHQIWCAFIDSMLLMVTQNDTEGKFTKEADVRSVYNHNCIPTYMYITICTICPNRSTLPNRSTPPFSRTKIARECMYL